MSLYLHIPAALDPPSRIAMIDEAFGHPLPQVDRNGKPAKNPVETHQFNAVPAVNKDGVVLEISTVYHMPPLAEKAVDGCQLYSEFGAIMAGIIDAPEDWVPAPDIRLIAEALPAQTRVAIWREFPTEKIASDFITAVGKEKKDIEMKKQPGDSKTVVKGIAEEMPIAALDDGAKIAEAEKIKDWTPVDGSKPGGSVNPGIITPGPGKEIGGR